MATYLHSGKLGDIVYSIPSYRASGCGEYLLWEPSGWGEDDVWGCEAAEFLRGEGIPAWVLRGGGVIDPGAGWVDGDAFRARLGWAGAGPTARPLNIGERHCAALGLPMDGACRPWLSITPDRREPVIFCRSARYRPKICRIDWAAVARAAAGRCAFVGFRSEWGAFCDDWGVAVPWIPTRDFGEAAAIVAGAGVVITNQTGLQAVAAGCGVPHLLERCEGADYCRAEHVRQWLTSSEFLASGALID